MYFIILAKFRDRPTKESLAKINAIMKKSVEQGAKYHGVYWTLGRYDAVVVAEGPNEKSAMKTLLEESELVSTETLVAIPREEAVKLLE